MGEQFDNFVDGKWVPAASGARFPSLNPANKTDVLGLFPRSDHRDVDRAAESARGHFERWRLVPAARRAEVLLRAAQLLAAGQEEMARLVTREMGKVLQEARVEAGEAVELLGQIAGEGRRLRGLTLPPEPAERFAMGLRVPVGVVAAIAPFTLPLAVPAGSLGAALMAGNAVVLKPAADTPLVATRLVQVLQEAGLPPGVVNLLHGAGEEAGAPLVRHPDVAMVAFTGSRAVGREVAIACAAEQKRLALVMGGANALLVMEDADLDLALDAAVGGAFATAGQSVAATGRVILHRKIARDFTERLVARAAGLRLGDGLQAGTDMGPLVNEARLKRVQAATRLGTKEGARLLCGGEPFRDGDCRRGFFYLPTVFGDVRPGMRIAQEEVPGPIVCLLTVGALEEAIAVANAGGRGHSAAVYTRDVQRAFVAARDLRADLVTVNGTPGGGDVAGGPVLGGLPPDAFTIWKEVAVDYGGRLPRGSGA